MTTELYRRVIAFDYGDKERSQITREVWEPTPWMIDVYVGNWDTDPRERQMLGWCFEQFGQELSPIHKRIGLWHRGGATVCGWTWFGFSLERDMLEFAERWPTPEGIDHPDRRAA